MGVEIEAKLKVDSLDAVRARLAEAGASFVRAGVEWNHHYDVRDGRLRASDSVLRVRQFRVTRGKSAPSTMTYKGPRRPGAIKQRPETEVEITDSDAAGRLLEALGFVLISTIEKRRESWDLLGCRVELDEVPYLGPFVEIEGPDEEAIARVQRTLGLHRLEHVKPGYVALLFAHCRRHGLDVAHIGFENG